MPSTSPPAVRDPQVPVLSVRRLCVHLRRRRWLGLASRRLYAVDGVDLDLAPGETLGLIGESGCGGTTLTRALAGQIKATAGSIRLEGVEATTAAGRQRLLQRVRRIDTSAAGSARRRAIKALTAALPASSDRQQRAQSLDTALREAGVSPEVAQSRWAELNPEQRLRVNLACALLQQPSVLICDRPEAGLDSAARLLFGSRLAASRRERGFALLMFSDDFEWLRRRCQRLAVLYLGRVVEQGPTAAVLDHPAHPYTRALLAAAGRGWPLRLDGQPPDPAHPPMGCRFHPRCSLAEAACVRSTPYLQRSRQATHYAACHFAPRGE